MHALVIHHIRPTAVQPRRFVGSVKINQKAIAGSHLRSPRMEVHRNLVVPVYVINLEALYSHLCIMSANILHIAVKGPISRPENDAHTVLFCVINKPFHVNFRNDLQKVCLQAYSPSVVENHVLDAVRGGKINVVPVGFVVDSRLEINPIDIPVVPPVPCHLTRFNPAPVRPRIRRRREFPHHIVHGKLRVTSADYDRPPRKQFISGDLRDEVLTLRHNAVKQMLAALLDSLGIWSEHTIKFCTPLFAKKIHTRPP